MLSFALLAQGGYALVFGGVWFWPLNVLFTFLSGVWMVQGRVFPGVLLSLMTEFPLGGLALYLLSRGQVFWGSVMVGGSLWLMGWSLWVVLPLSLLVFPIWAVVHRGVPGKRVPWWWAYSFYPLHLWILGGVEMARRFLALDFREYEGDVVKEARFFGVLPLYRGEALLLRNFAMNGICGGKSLF